MRLLYIPTVFILACSGETEKTDGNSAPVIQSLSITGDTFSTSDTLTCAVQYTDEDEDVVTESYEWTNQNGDIIGVNDLITLQVGVVEPLEMASHEGSWAVARRLELTGSPEPGLASMQERQMAARDELLQIKLKEATAKASGKGRGAGDGS